VGKAAQAATAARLSRLRGLAILLAIKAVG
jgi:hypothetical protein